MVGILGAPSNRVHPVLDNNHPAILSMASSVRWSSMRIYDYALGFFLVALSLITLISVVLGAVHMILFIVRRRKK